MDKEQIAIMRLKEAAKMSEQIYGQPLIVTTSGGKDSSVCLALAERAGIKYEVMHSHTTADAPETVKFIRDEFKRIEQNMCVSGTSSGGCCKLTINQPVYKGRRTSMWDLIPQKLMPPTRLMRYCCSILKETCGIGRFITTGVRWAESVARKKNRGIYEANRDVILNNDNDDRRALFESCTLKAKRVCNPIIDWTDDDVWDFINSESITLNPLYYCGFSRVGCIGCPLAGKRGRQIEFARFPKYKKNYILAFERMIEERKKKGLQTDWETGQDVFYWWIEDDVLPGQTNLFDNDKEIENVN